MKKLLLLLAVCMTVTCAYSQFGNIKDKAKGILGKKDKGGAAPEEKNTQPPAGNKPADTVVPATAFKAYQNYDFVPGDKIIFEDNFVADEDGEFPAHWKLINGQAVVNKVAGEPALAMIEGNYVKVMPRMKTPTYLGAIFTIEFDYWINDGSEYGVTVFFTPSDDTEARNLRFTGQGESSSNFPGNGLNGTAYPGETGDAYYRKWHHVAIVYKNQQVKCYLDQYRVLVIPEAEFTPVSVSFGGIDKVTIKNVRIADGGGMNMLNKLATDGKIVTHGITFDVNKSTIKPESMGTLNMIVKLMNEKSDLKFEVGGHTDADGEDAYNMKLSQQRAEAVKAQLQKMGIDASRLTAKGYGETKPLSDNTTPESKANNRRVEFVKQ